MEIAEWLKKLPEANINTKVKDVQTALSALHLEDDEEIVSLDVESLFTTVPVQETIYLAADLLYSDENDTPDIDKETFVALLKMVSVSVMFKSRTCEYYRQIDGVAMGSTVGPLLANIFFSQYDSEIALHSISYFRYVDDIVRTMIRGGENLLLQFVNTLHSNLRFTLEKETAEHVLPFLDLELKKVGNRIVSNWYRKKTDTGIDLNFHATVPKIYLSSIISGFVHRIFNFKLGQFSLLLGERRENTF